MLVNSCLTVYHNDFDEEKRIGKWIRFNYGDSNKNTVWFHGGKGARVNKGYENANDVEIRIPYALNPGLDITNFKAGDILVQGYLELDIKTQQDLVDYEIFNITSLVDNTFGNNKHIRLGGK